VATDADQLDDLRYCAERVFDDDGTLDMAELNLLLGLVLRDRVMDDDERKLLAEVFGRVTADDVEPRVWHRICQLRSRYGI